MNVAELRTRIFPNKGVGETMKTKILFLCTGNSCRSQMAEGWARRLKSGAVEAESAGVAPKGVDPRAVKVMSEAGVDICLLSLADTLATYGPELPQEVWLAQLDTVRALLSAYWEEGEKKIVPATLLTGHDLITDFKMKPGPRIGHILEALREAQVTGDVEDRQQAIHFVQEWLKQSAN